MRCWTYAMQSCKGYASCLQRLRSELTSCRPTRPSWQLLAPSWRTCRVSWMPRPALRGAFGTYDALGYLFVVKCCSDILLSFYNHFWEGGGGVQYLPRTYSKVWGWALQFLILPTFSYVNLTCLLIHYHNLNSVIPFLRVCKSNRVFL